jgi:tetratricopeptide (TPR) repeat protein
MKTRIKNLAVLTLIFLICAAPSISFDAMFPAEKQLPNYIKTIAVVDRSGRESKLSNIIEGGLTGEGIGQDREASRRLIEGLTNQVNSARKYWVVKTNMEMVIEAEPGKFSKPLSSAHIRGICQQHNAEAVLALEYFDTDRIGENLHAHVGIRIYDGKTLKIIDEHAFTNSVHIARKSDDLVNLVSNYMGTDVVNSLSYESGVIYGQRISPFWLRVERKYYKRAKGNKEFAMGARMIEVNDWENAIDAFNQTLNSSKRKVLARANHNLAVIYEILGDYEKAKEYALTAWVQYKNKDSQNYPAILTQRMAEIQKLKEQGE